MWNFILEKTFLSLEWKCIFLDFHQNQEESFVSFTAACVEVDGSSISISYDSTTLDWSIKFGCSHFSLHLATRASCVSDVSSTTARGKCERENHRVVKFIEFPLRFLHIIKQHIGSVPQSIQSSSCLHYLHTLSLSRQTIFPPEVLQFNYKHFHFLHNIGMCNITR